MSGEQRTLDEVSRAHVLAVLAACRYNMTLASKILEIDRKTLVRHLKRWEFWPLNPPPRR